MSKLQTNTTSLQSLLDKANALPIAEDLEEVITAQETKLVALEAALDGKAGNENTIETCTLTVNVTDNGQSSINRLVLTEVVDGNIVLNESCPGTSTTPQVFIVPCNSFVYMYGTGGGNPNPTHSSNITLIDNMFMNTHIYLYKMPSEAGSAATITHYCG